MSTEVVTPTEPSFADAFTEAANNQGTIVDTIPTPQAEETIVINEVETPEPVVETPVTDVVETPVIATLEVEAENPVVEITADTTPKEVIREVEKIVEKYPEFKSDKAKAIYESILASDDDNAEQLFYDYLNEKKRDYTVMSDLDVVKTAIEKANPQWNAKDVDLELRDKYGEDLVKIDLSDIDKDEDPDKYDEAVKHNKTVDRNLTLIARDARDSRYQLINDQKSLELPKIEKATNTPAPLQPTAEEIAENKRVWDAKVEDLTKDGLRDFKIKIGDKDFAYKFSDDDRSSAVEKTKNFNFNDFAVERGWLDAEGNSNPLKLAEDVQKLNNFEKIIKAFATQSKTQGTKEAIKDIKNITPTSTAAPIDAVTFADAFEDAFAKSRN